MTLSLTIADIGGDVEAVDIRALMHVPVAKNRSETCDCGQDKGKYAEACESCSYFDGGTTNRAAIITAMRDSGAITLRDAVIAVNGVYKRRLNRSVLRTLRDMERTGRIRRYWSEESHAEERAVFSGTGVCGYGCWRYTLSGRS